MKPPTRGLNFASYHRASAAQFRRRAALAASPELAKRLLRIAAHHDRLAILEAGGSPGEIRRLAGLHTAVGNARRHVKQGEARVARQEVLLAKLKADSRHALLAGQASRVLATLQHSLRLAREHLAHELAERGMADRDD